MEFKKKTKPKNLGKKQKKKYILNNLDALLEVRERVLGAFESRFFRQGLRPF